MWPRLRLDISPADLMSGLTACISARDAAGLAAHIEHSWGPRPTLVCLSVRSALDLTLSALELPAGSEVLLSALTIRDMAHIVEAHDLVCVPVDVDPETLAPPPAALEEALTERTRAICVAHLFGALAPIDPVVAFAREHGLLVIEDCAQALGVGGPDWRGDERADFNLFSFGPIKTRTALGGALVCVRDADVAARMRALHAEWPEQARSDFTRRVFKYMWLWTLGTTPVFTAVNALVALAGKDIDELLNGSARSFPGASLLAAIRRRPCAPQLALLARRIDAAEDGHVARRARTGEELARGLGEDARPFGSRAVERTHWIFPVRVDDPDATVRRLRAAGFDATRHSSLVTLEPPPGRSGPTAMRSALSRTVFVPVPGNLPHAALPRLAALLSPRGAEP